MTTTTTTTVELRRGYLVKHVEDGRVHMTGGVIRMKKDQFPLNMALFEMRLLLPVFATVDVVESLEAPDHQNRFSVLDVVTADGILNGPIAMSDTYEGRAGSQLSIGASGLGIKYRGNIGSRMRNMDAR